MNVQFAGGSAGGKSFLTKPLKQLGSLTLGKRFSHFHAPRRLQFGVKVDCQTGLRIQND
jgi:hypothetical protein